MTVLKTIRLHLNGMMSWLGKYPKLKVHSDKPVSLSNSTHSSQIIHLIRDPRFQINSRRKMKGFFHCESGDEPGYCRSVEDDLRRGSHLSPSLYRLVRYEDLNRDPLPVMKDLYKFIGVSVTETIIQKINDHFHAENASHPTRKGKFSTFKESEFASNNLESIPKSIRDVAKEHCYDLLQLGHYH